MPTFDLRTTYDRFFALGGPPDGAERPWQYRRKETSLRYPGCELLVKLVRARQPKRVLDLGSGLTSHILRGLQQEWPRMEVVTVDTDLHWLETTWRELRRDGLSLARCYDYHDFLAVQRVQQEAHGTGSAFDLISVDHGNITFRAGEAEHLREWCASPGGILLIDDWHMPPLDEVLRPALHALGFQVRLAEESRDEAGGVVALAEWR